MALSDDKKLQLVSGAIEEWLHSFTDWPTFKTVLQGLTKTQLKTFILNALQTASAEDLVISAELQTASTDKDDLHTEVTNDI